MTKSLRVLLIEDYEDDAELLLRELRRCGYAPEMTRVETGPDFEAALDRIGWDVVIADFQLPRITVLEAMAILRARELDLPFIIVSGAIPDDEAVEALRAGAHDFISKGRWARLGPAIERELGEASNRRERRRADDVLRFLAEASKRLTASLNYGDMGEVVARMSVPFLGDWCAVLIREPESGGGSLAVACVDPSRELSVEAALQTILTDQTDWRGRLLPLRSETVRVADLSVDDGQSRQLRPEHVAQLNALGARSFFSTPLVSRRGATGVLVLVRAEAGVAVSAADGDVAADLAHRAASAVDNSLLFAAERQARALAERSVERISRLQSITARMASAATVEEITRTIVSAGIAAADADAGLVALLSPDGDEVEVVSSSGYPPHVRAYLSGAWRRVSIDADIPVSEAIRTGHIVALASEDARARRYPHTPQTGYEASVVIPMKDDRGPIGVLALNFAAIRTFDRDDLLFLETLANQCGQALQRARLYESERQAVRIRDEFLSVAAHELRTPLTGLSLQAQLAQRRLERRGAVDVTREIEDFRAISRQATKASDLINQLLDVSRIEAGRLTIEPRPTDISSLVESVVQLLSERSTGHTITTRTAGPIVAAVDPLRIEQVITNLVDNSIKYTPDHGRIDVEVQLNSPDSVSIRVTDDGIGIPVERRGQIFDRYYRAHGDSHQSGLGLGLYISRQIVELHGGKIRAEFPNDGGSSFNVELPIGSAVAPAAVASGEHAG
jgi:signal transduction histidine kinase/CheY-like chemotaxis protein